MGARDRGRVLPKAREADAHSCSGDDRPTGTTTPPELTPDPPAGIIMTAGGGGPEVVPCCWRRAGPIKLAGDIVRAWLARSVSTEARFSPPTSRNRNCPGRAEHDDRVRCRHVGAVDARDQARMRIPSPETLRTAIMGDRGIDSGRPGAALPGWVRPDFRVGGG